MIITITISAVNNFNQKEIFFPDKDGCGSNHATTNEMDLGLFHFECKEFQVVFPLGHYGVIDVCNDCR